MKTFTALFVSAAVISSGVCEEEAKTINWNTVAPIEQVLGTRYCEVKCTAQEIPKYCPGGFDDLDCQCKNINKIQASFSFEGPFFDCMVKTCTANERDDGKFFDELTLEKTTNHEIFTGKAASILSLCFRADSPTFKPTAAEMDEARKPWADRLRSASEGKPSNPSGKYPGPAPGRSKSDAPSSPSSPSSGSGGDNKKSGAI